MQERTSISRQNLNENLETLHQAPTLFYHLACFYLKTGLVLYFMFMLLQRVPFYLSLFYQTPFCNITHFRRKGIIEEDTFWESVTPYRPKVISHIWYCLNFLSILILRFSEFKNVIVQYNFLHFNLFTNKGLRS